MEGKYVALDRIVASDFRPRFIPVQELVALSPRLDTGAINPYYPLTLGSIQVWLGIAGTLAFLGLILLDWLRPPVEPQPSMLSSTTLLGSGLFFILFTAFCAFMATGPSEPVWTVLPFVDLFEWPFRWHGFTAVGLAWLCAFLVHTASRLHARAETVAALIALLLLMGTAAVNLYPHKLAPGRLHSPAEVVRYESRTGAIGTTSLGEFNPIWVDETFSTSPLVEDYRTGVPIDRLKHQLPAGASGEQTYSSVHRQEFRVDLPQPAVLTLNLLYFPGWRAEIDGTPVPVEPHPGSGLLDVAVPAGEHTLALTFGPTPLRRAAGWISVLAWIALVVTAVIVSRPIAGDESSQDGDLPTAWPAIVGTRQWPALSSHWRRRSHSSSGSTPRPMPHPLPAYRCASTSPTRFACSASTRRRPIQSNPVDAVRGGLSARPDRRGQRITPSSCTSTTRSAARPSPPSIVAIPGGIPTSDWPTGLYVRSPLKLTVPPDADPIQYALRLGLLRPAHRRPAAAHRRQRRPLRGRSASGSGPPTGAYAGGSIRPLWRPH